MINTLNMLNYLEQRDLNGARVEARRLAVMQKYYRDTLNQPNNPVLGLGSLLAGFTFEKSGETDEALRYYDEALAARKIFPSAWQALINLIDHGMALQEAVEAPRIWTEGVVLEVEHGVPEKRPHRACATVVTRCRSCRRWRAA